MLSKFAYYKPESLEEALSYLEKNPRTRILAGGTDIMLLLRRNVEICEHLLNIKGIPEANTMSYTPNEGLFIGAAITVNEICEDVGIRKRYPSLSGAADNLASYQIRNRATVVGNICNASPGADLAAPLLVYDAKVHIASTEGNRIVEINEFFAGVKKTVLKENEIVTGVFIPDVELGDNSVYLRKSRIKGHDLCNVGLALRLTPEKRLLMAIAAVSTTPLRLTELEKSVEGKEITPELADWIVEEIKKYMNPRPNSVRSSAEYRYHIAGVLIKRGLKKLLEKEAN
ncbi:xanthine dehydrogenase family protein subunit M [Schnuerera sp. xch1]|uniref:FAD binding domain-containing protein n=1 Tax=Schnuerera sp. xch1 TaxID=2874283 RepID=UPI001CBB990D|nr:xanthine dehydrogenase family protein subunit M [Schnuerera sp. xch1]MBZ2175179.1 xanthine dehydrogenase family protein subunit M [Schnuerera sp. xch1]